MRYGARFLFRIFGALAHGAASDIPKESRSDPGREPSDAGTWMRLPFLSRRFVIGSLIAFSILVANAFVSYRTIANLIEASRTAENTLKLVGALKDLQRNVSVRRSSCADTSSAVSANVSPELRRLWVAPPILSRH